MNTQPGLIGRKLGCTQLFDEEGNIQSVTAIEVGPCLSAAAAYRIAA